MSLVVTVCWVFLGLGLVPHTVNGIDFNELLKILGGVTPDEILNKETKIIQGRRGFLPDNYFDENCRSEERSVCYNERSRTDLCFIVQISCPSNKRVRNKILQDIKEIISKVGNQSCYTIVTYSKTAKKFIDWTNTTKKVNKKFKGPSKCEDCQARLPTALDLCKRQLKKKNENSRDIVPDVIVTYTDGLSFKSKFNNTYQITTVIPKLLEVQQCPNTAGRAFKLRDYSYASEEWPLLEFDNIDIAHSYIITDLNINPYEVEIPAVEGITEEGDPLCPHCCNADVVIIIDRSESILKDDLTNVLKFFEEFITALEDKILPLGSNPAEPGLRFAILTYNCPIFIHCYLGEKDYPGLIECVKGIPPETGKYTNTVDALKKAKNQFDDYGRNSTEVREIVIIATDGRTWDCNANKVADPAATIAAAKDLKDAGKEIYVYGLPNHKGIVDGCTREWIHVASEPKACHILDFTEGTFSEEDLLLGGTHLVKEICTQGEDHPCPFTQECHNN